MDKLDIGALLYSPCKILRTRSAEYPCLRQEQAAFRTQSAEYPRYYLSIEPPSKKYFKPLTQRIITQNDIVMEEMHVLVYGYIRKLCICNESLTFDIVEIIKLIVSKCPVLERFNNDGQDLWCASKSNRKIEHYPSNERRCERLYLKIECFAANGYKTGIRWLSIQYNHTGCVNQFGVTNKSDKVYRARRTFPDLYELQHSKECKVCFQEHSGGIISIKLDCNAWKVTFYKDYSRKLYENKIDSNEAYWFFVYFCLCTESRVCFEIVPTDYSKAKKMEFEMAHRNCYCDECAHIHHQETDVKYDQNEPYKHQTFMLFEDAVDGSYESLYDQSDNEPEQLFLVNDF